MSLAPAGSSNSRGVTQATQKKNGVRNGGGGGLMRTKDDECFGGQTDENMDADFDFEGNLALFNKAAVFSQIDVTNSLNNRAQHHSIKDEHKPVSYRHDENILEVKPVIYRQIAVPQHGGKEYCTGENTTHRHTHTCIGALFMYLSFLCYSRFLNVVLSVNMAAINSSTNIETAAKKVVESCFRPTSCQLKLPCSVCTSNSGADPDMTHEDLGLLVKKWINICYSLPDEIVTSLKDNSGDTPDRHHVISKVAPPLGG